MTILQDDAKERAAALDPTRSFIVQAPAGSGKTELLTQRFLVLLGQVLQPEEILSLTFTKKAALEMRTRIIQALKKAKGPMPTEPHAKHTWHLAKKALQRDTERQWHLLDNPNRLRIQTIDSFNAYLTKQLPILSKFGAPPAIVNDARPLYQEAIFELFSHLEDDLPWAPSIEHLLSHFDNDLNKVASLLLRMLAKRDQWLPYITLDVDQPLVRQTLESHLATITTDALQQLKNNFPNELTPELIVLIQFAAHQLVRENSTSAITHCKDLSHLPGTTVADKKRWLGISELLLTKELNWRKRIDKTIGFPAATSFKNKQEREDIAQMKQRMMDFINTISSCEPLHQAFIELQLSPACFYEEDEWLALKAFLILLRVAVAQLKLIFEQHGQIDYIENAQAALLALGTEEGPTDLALALDYRIQHILIDEFQDTSRGQYQLIEKLTLGWTTDDGRTLFVVGDPMQSIYRFREAEVGLFISARQHGIGQVPLVPLTLTVNFRSSAGIVAWTNQHFKSVLPAVDMISMGAVAYSPSMTQQTQTDTAVPVQLHGFIDQDEGPQAHAIVRLVQSIQLTQPEVSIAILVRSRSHLTTILPAFKKAQLKYRAIEIDPLKTRFVVQDLLSLTRALLYPADRIAWLAILRAPWCGLCLHDLWHVAGTREKACLWERLRRPDIQARLSEAGQQRIRSFIAILEIKMAERQRGPLRTWIESTWYALGGPACLDQTSELEDANVFFELLETLDQGGDLSDLSQLTEAIHQLYAAPDTEASDRLQIMTVHNAKGLEFDVVILPHLERKPPHQDKELLLWMERARAMGQTDFILAPVHAIGQPQNSIYEYIKRKLNLKTDYEYGRLLYVAATRAKQQLHLFFSLPDHLPDTTPASYSLLEKLWPSIKNQVHLQRPPAITVSNDAPPGELTRLTQGWANPFIETATPLIAYHQKQAGFFLTNGAAKSLGTIVHALLQQISHRGKKWWQEKSKKQQQLFLEHFFVRSGLSEMERMKMIDKAIAAIENTLQDTRGQWILTPHVDARSEFCITAFLDDETHTLVIDRTFIDETGTRWIIDYKTSSPLPDESMSAFLQKEETSYALQMQRYAHAIKNLSPHPVRLGLFFPMLPAWTEWSPTF